MIEVPKPLKDLSAKEMADLLQLYEAEAKNEAKIRRPLTTLYGFDPAAKGLGGYTRIPNIIFTVFSTFKAKNLDTDQIVTKNDGTPLWTEFKENKDGNPECVPANLAQLELSVILYMLSIYQRTGNRRNVSFSKKELSKNLGKSYSTINRSVDKLERLAYIKKQDKRIGVKGGHVRQYDITPFIEELQKAVYRYRITNAQKAESENALTVL